MAQTEESSAYEQLKQLEWLIGDQVGEYQLPEGRPEFGPAGAKVVREVSVRWASTRAS